MSTKYFLATALAVTALLNPISARSADAQTWWSKIAAGCVVDSASAAKADLNSGFGTVSFKGAKLGRIKLTCAISGLFRSAEFPLDPVAMNVSFYDPDGRATGCGVRASLLRSNLAAQERGLDIVSFDSNTGFVDTEPGTGRSTGSVAVPEPVDFGTSYYWIQLELVRGSTACNPVAVGVHVTPIIIIP
jgi:hypothetical protein